MTVSANVSRVTFAGDDVTTSFDLGSTFIFFAETELQVSVVTDATGVEEDLTLTTDYTVSGGDGATGTVDTSGGHGALLTGTTLVVRRVLPITQTDDFVNGQISDAEVIEDRFDRLTMIAQQLDDESARALRAPATEDEIDPLPTRAARRNKFFKFDDTADAKPTAVAITELSSGGTILDEDDLGSDSDVDAPSQQSVAAHLTANYTKNTDTDISAKSWVLDEDTLVSDDDTKAPTQQSVKAYADNLMAENLLVNGSMRVAQQGTSFTAATTPANNDDTYTLDQCILLSDGNDIVDVSQGSDGGVDGGSEYLRCLVATIQKKAGILIPIENKDCLSVLGGNVSLSFDLRVSDASKMDDIRAAVLAWDGTADAITSDVVSAWAVEDTNPTLATNWTFENTPANIGATATWTRFAIEDVDIDTSSAANVAVFVWSNAVADNDTLGTTLDITNVKLQKGPVATPFVARPYAQSLTLCQRYLQVLDNDVNATRFGVVNCFTTNDSYSHFRHQPDMLKAPSLVVSAASDFQVFESGSGHVCTSVTLDSGGIAMSQIKFTSTGNFSAGNAGHAQSATTDARLTFDARL